MERNGKLALTQILIGVIAFILALIVIIVGIDSGKVSAIKAPVSITIIIVNVLTIILAVVQIFFGGRDKMWLGMTAGIISTSSAIVGFAHLSNWIIIAASIVVLILNIITAVKSKSFKNS